MERVVVARLRDAAFFCAEDLKRPLADRVDRPRRGDLPPGPRQLPGQGRAHGAAGRRDGRGDGPARRSRSTRPRGEAALLAKADLTTLMVREFPELQGVMGGIYLAGAGRRPGERGRGGALALPPDLGRGGQRARRGAFAGGDGTRLRGRVRWPTSSTPWPATSASASNPTGSSDPFGLRRAGQGAVRALLDFWSADVGGAAPEPAGAWSTAAVAGYGAALKRPPAEVAAATSRPSSSTACATCSSARGFPADEVEAVLLARAASPTPSTIRTECAGPPRRRCTGCGSEAREDFEQPGRGLQAGQEHPRQQAAAPSRSSPRSFEHDAERELHAAVAASLGDRTAATTRGSGRWPALRGPVDRFFDDVLVMAEDPKVRANRLALLAPNPVPLLSASRTSRNSEDKRDAQYVYFFGGGKADGNKDMKDLLGGKGSGLAEMTNAGLPVPPGFTISTAACNLYMERGGSLPAEIDQRDRRGPRASSRSLMGKKLGRGRATRCSSPCAAGAKFSMPGMMDTILNLGLNDQSVEGLKAKTGNGRFAKDSLPALHPDVRQRGARHRQGRLRARARRGQEEEQGRRPTSTSTRARFDDVIARYKVVVQKQTGHAVPAGPARAARGRARRRLQVLDEPARRDLPQAERHPARPRHRGQRPEHGLRQHGRHARPPASASPATPRPARKEFYGEFLQNAQGEDVVAGIRTPHPIADLEKVHARGLPAAPRDHDPPGAALQGRPGLRVHDPGRTSSTCSRPATASGPGWPRSHIAVDLVRGGDPHQEGSGA